MVVQAKTVEDAVRLACHRLNASRDNVDVHVLEQPKKGFFGLFGMREARVEVERIFDPVEEAVRFLGEVITKMGLSAEIEVESASSSSKPVVLHLKGDKLGILIGRRGQTLESLQYLVNIAANRGVKKQVRFMLDADGYRKRREEALVNLAERLAKQVLRTKKEIVLDPMPPGERRIIHGAIQKEKRLTTHSVGDEPNRRVVISWKD
ncbi:RNA-binding cell elongation regulator Jag/EloR [Paenactinomyces guangxiensis]|uniref:RNA-binding cell elongation regulator Jag/EloR n=1 Tax=Paenactinomyces guangxiensis TaxID=1490290 RepID=UPI002868167B|nr:RNA-binding cell elongation regulator Jag/EloR [Paenactinomyces guangxiensis]